MNISICIPVYNSQATIKALVEKIFNTFNSYKFEIILVNDCSKDKSEELCLGLCDVYNNIKFISLRKNVGEHNAVICALNYAVGDYVLIMDDDLQNEPREALKLLEHIENGYDVVYSKYKKKKHNIFRNIGSKFNDIVATWLLNKPKGLYLSSFKVMTKDIVREIIKYKGPFTYIDGLILRLTDNISSVFVEHYNRESGDSNYTFKKLISLWLNMFINFSINPLRLFTFFGITLSLFSFLLGLYFMIEKFLYPNIILGWTSIIVSILFLSGIQISFLGLLGEYVGKHYLHSNGSPQYIIKFVKNSNGGGVILIPFIFLTGIVFLLLFL